MRAWARERWASLHPGTRASLGMLLFLPGGMVLLGVVVLVTWWRAKGKKP